MLAGYGRATPTALRGEGRTAIAAAGIFPTIAPWLALVLSWLRHTLNEHAECSRCGRHLRDLVYHLIELHPHR